MRRSIVIRGAVVILVDAVVLLGLSALLPDFTLDGPAAALATAALVGVLNALVWPFLARLALPLSVLTLGLAGLALNAALVTLAINGAGRPHRRAPRFVPVRSRRGRIPRSHGRIAPGAAPAAWSPG